MQIYFVTARVPDFNGATVWGSHILASDAASARSSASRLFWRPPESTLPADVFAFVNERHDQAKSLGVVFVARKSTADPSNAIA